MAQSDLHLLSLTTGYEKTTQHASGDGLSTLTHPSAQQTSWEEPSLEMTEMEHHLGEGNKC